MLMHDIDLEEFLKAFTITLTPQIFLRVFQKIRGCADFTASQVRHAVDIFSASFPECIDGLVERLLNDFNGVNQKQSDQGLIGELVAHPSLDVVKRVGKQVPFLDESIGSMNQDSLLDCVVSCVYLDAASSNAAIDVLFVLFNSDAV